MAKKLTLSILSALILLFFAPPMVAALTPQEVADELKKGEEAFGLAKAARDKDIADVMNSSFSDIEKQMQIRNLQDEFLKKSREIHLKYREPILQQVIAETNAKLPEGKKIEKGAGSDIYLKDEITGNYVFDDEGKHVLNPKHRGWQGDLDLGGDARAVEHLEETLEKYDIRLTSDPMVAPGYKDFETVQVTINVEGRMDKPGSSTHLTQVQMDSFSKETYVSMGMGERQAGRKLVETNDHVKKAIKGIISEPAELVADLGSGGQHNDGHVARP